MIRSALSQIITPAYVADRQKIAENLSVAARIKAATGCKILLATKAFSMFSLFDDFAQVLDGTTASGLYEAKLGHEHFHGEVHAYSPAYTDAEIEALLPICGHLYFNSISQLQHYLKNHSPVRSKHTLDEMGAKQSLPPLRGEVRWGGKNASSLAESSPPSQTLPPKGGGSKPSSHGTAPMIGLRVNPRLSLVQNNAIYDPSAPNSRFGVQFEELTPEILKQIDILHVHNLCENLAEDSVALIDHLMAKIPQVLDAVQAVNLGGGHYITHPDYDVDKLIAAIKRLQKAHDVEVILEPGGALVYDTGYLVASVVDVIPGNPAIAILDTSATCHMPDVLEVPYRPNVIGDIPNGKHRYLLTGKTCLTGDIIGEYAFDAPLKPGDKIVFLDMMQYSMVKNTTFNGTPLPDIGVLEKDGSYRVVKRFGYEDFKERLS